LTLFTTASGAQGITPDDYAALFVQPVQAESTAFQVAAQLTTDSTRMHLPIVVEDAGAAWVSEGDEIPNEDATLGEEVVIPAKVAGLTVVSSELAEDSNPDAQQIVGNGLARSIARQVDAAFYGSLPHPAPRGLERLAGVSSVSAGKKWANLDPFLAAIAAAENVGAALTSFTAHPSDALTLAQLKEQTDSNRPLLGSDPTTPTRRVIAGVPLYVSPAVTPGTVWGIPRDRVFIVLRHDVRVDISADAYFSSDQVAVRGTMRVGFGYPHPAAVAKVTLTP
jgi:HK97 family phage major capsid protein